MSADYSIHELCAALEVSRSGYHAWARRVPGPRARANAELLGLILKAHAQSRQTYGSWLRERGYACGRHRIARLMRGAGQRQRQRRRFRISLTDSDHDLPVAPNRLMGQPPPGQADAVWVADITYVDTKEGWLYLAGVLDRRSRRCVGWAMSDTLATSLPLAALDMALTQRRPPEGLVHHFSR